MQYQYQVNQQIKPNLLDLGSEHHFRMKKILILILLLNINTFKCNAEIAYIDLNFILNKSEVGKSLNIYIEEIRNKNLIKFKEIENELVKKENQLISQQNIINKDEFEKKFNILSEEVKKYRSDMKLSQDQLNKIKIENSKKILQILNPIIRKYVEENSISLVLPKKNIIVGKKDLEITNKIIKLLNDQNVSLEL